MTDDEKRHSRAAFYFELGQVIQDVRYKQGMSQEQLADYMELTRAQVANIEAGRCKLFVHQLIQISVFFGEPLETFVRFDPAYAE